VTDVNEAPTAVVLTNVVATLDEFVKVTSRVCVVDISVTDDAWGLRTLSLSGTGAASFEIITGKLYLKAGTVLSAVSKPSYTFTVSAADTGVSGSTPVTVTGTLGVTTKVPTITGSTAITIAIKSTLTCDPNA